MLKRIIPLISLCLLPFTAQAEPPAGSVFATTVIAEGLEVSWDMEFSPDGRLFISERAGRIRIWENGQLRDAPWVEVFAARAAESGLLEHWNGLTRLVR